VSPPVLPGARENLIEATKSAVAPVSHRRVGATMAAAVTDVVTMGDLLPWYLGALGELHAMLDARGVRPSGPAGGMAAYVASYALRVEGPIREHFLIGRQDTADENAWRTEICWPIFSTGAAV
jgi:hypothetical protein